MNGEILSIAPLIDLRVIIALGGIGLLIVAYSMMRGVTGAPLRLLILAVLIAALCNPKYVREQRDPQNDIAVVVIDRTSSQNVGDRAEQTEAALIALRQRAQPMKKLDIREVDVFDGTGEDGNEGSNLLTALSQAVGEISKGRFAGAVMITDGQVHDADGNGAAGGALGGPLHVLLSGHPGERDRRLVIDSAPSYGIVGQNVSITYHVEDKRDNSALGSLGDLAEVVLKNGETIISRAQIEVGKKDTFTFELDHAGTSILEIEVAPVDGELSTTNNRTLVTLNGVRDRLKVLLVSGKPHAGERTWRNLLKADPSVDLVHFTILRPPEKDDFTPLNELALISFPVQELFEVKLAEFDLIVFDRYILRDILPPSYFQNIADYVRNGGAVLLSVGSEFADTRNLSDTSLGKIIPARPTGAVLERAYRPDISKIGNRHPVTEGLSSLSRINRENPLKPGWGRWFRQIEATVQSGITVMTGLEDRPLLVLDRNQDGRIALMLSDQAWLWARGYDGGGPQAELLRRLAHWLMKEPDLEEESLRATISGGELHIQRRSLSDEGITIEVTSPSGKVVQIQSSAVSGPGRRVSIPATEVGLYEISDGTLKARATSGTLNPLEFADLTATPDRILMAVNKSGGGLRWIKDGAVEVRRVQRDRDLNGRDWFGFIENNTYVVTGVFQVPVLPGVVLMIVLLGLLMAAWWREGRS